MIYNEGYAALAGGRHPALLGLPVREGWPEVAEFNDRVMREGLAGRSLSFRDQEMTLKRNGAAEALWFDLDYSPVRDDAGRPVGVLAIVVETSARVRAERQLLGEQGRLRQMFEQAPGLIAMLEGPEHVFTLANKAMERFIGRELIGRPIREAVPEAEAQGFVATLDDVRRTGRPFVGHGVPIRLELGAGGPGGPGALRRLRLPADHRRGRRGQRHLHREPRRHRAQARRGGAARERGAVPAGGGAGAGDALDGRRHRRVRLSQRGAAGVLGRGARGRGELRLEHHGASRRRGDAAAAVREGDARTDALRRRVPAAPGGRGPSADRDQRPAALRRRGRLPRDDRGQRRHHRGARDRGGDPGGIGAAGHAEPDRGGDRRGDRDRPDRAAGLRRLRGADRGAVRVVLLQHRRRGGGAVHALCAFRA